MGGRRPCSKRKSVIWQEQNLEKLEIVPDTTAPEAPKEPIILNVSTEKTD